MTINISMKWAALFLISNFIFCNKEQGDANDVVDVALSYIPEQETIIDKGQGRNLLEQPTRITPKDVTGFFNPTPKDIALLHKYFKDIHSLETTSTCKIRSLKYYLFQYIGVIIKGKKFIYINAARKDGPIIKRLNWKDVPIWVSDGGNDFFGILFDLKFKKFTQLVTNC